MADHSPRIAVVTGVGSGIGAAVAYGRVDLLFNNDGAFSPARELETVPLAEGTSPSP